MRTEPCCHPVHIVKAQNTLVDKLFLPSNPRTMENCRAFESLNNLNRMQVNRFAAQMKITFLSAYQRQLQLTA